MAKESISILQDTSCKMFHAVIEYARQRQFRPTNSDETSNMKTETKTAHTPGTWRIKPYASADVEGLHIRSSNGGDLIACISFTEWMDKAEARANARLIAAAPELLAALKLAAPVITRDVRNGVCPNALEIAARAAIAKAEGASE